MGLEFKCTLTAWSRKHRAKKFVLMVLWTSDTIGTHSHLRRCRTLTHETLLKMSLQAKI